MDNYYCFLLVPIGNPAFRQVIRRNLNLDLVAWKDSDIVHPDFPRNVSEHFKAVFKLDPELCIGKRFQNFAFHLY